MPRLGSSGAVPVTRRKSCELGEAIKGFSGIIGFAGDTDPGRGSAIDGGGGGSGFPSSGLVTGSGIMSVVETRRDPFFLCTGVSNP